MRDALFTTLVYIVATWPRFVLGVAVGGVVIISFAYVTGWVIKKLNQR